MSLKEWYAKHRAGWYRPEYKKAYYISSIPMWCATVALLGLIIWMRVNSIVLILGSDVDTMVRNMLLVIVLVIAISSSISITIAIVDTYEKKIGESSGQTKSV